MISRLSFRRAPRRGLVAALGLALLLSGLPGPARATDLPPGFVETHVASVTSPTTMEFAPDGRLFVSQQAGQLRVVKNGVLLPQPFVTVAASSVGERGLLGIAFDPNFAATSSSTCTTQPTCRHPVTG